MSDDLLQVAEACARAAGELLLERFQGGPGAVGQITTKSTPTDLVSESDLAAEQAIRAILAAERPDDAIMGEEGDDTPGTSGLRWIVDPLDGTINYLFGHPQWCVSVACEGRAGVVFDPVRDELFTVGPGSAPALNGRALVPGDRDELATALVGTGFAYDARVRTEQARLLLEVLPRVRDVRRAGAAALDLAWTAAGRLDAYYERGVNPWDVAAGNLLCAGVGLEVHDLPARDGLPSGVVVAPGAIAPALLALVA